MRKYGITLGPFWASELVGMLWHQMPAGRLAIFSCKVVAVSCLKLVVALKELQVCSGQGLELYLSLQDAEVAFIDTCKAEAWDVCSCKHPPIEGDFQALGLHQQQPVWDMKGPAPLDPILDQ